MAHLFVNLYDRVDSPNPFHILDDQNENNRLYFHDLNAFSAADKAARVVVRPGDEYRTGDHIRLLDKVRRSNTPSRSVDPAVVGDVDLNRIDFADKAAAVQIVTNSDPNGGFRLRVLLYNSPEQTEIPDLVLYDWEFPPSVRFADLNLFGYADTVAYIRVQKGPNYKSGDRIFLWDSLESGSDSMAYEPGDYDLNVDGWADKAAGVEFDLQPPVSTP